MSTADPNIRLYMQYLGAVGLLGRIARWLPKGHEDRYGLDAVMKDANNLLLARNSDIVYLKSNGGGYAAFERSQLKKTEPGR